MKLLLDTHTVLWFYLSDPQLSAAASTAIMDPANEKWVALAEGMGIVSIDPKLDVYGVSRLW